MKNHYQISVFEIIQNYGQKKRREKIKKEIKFSMFFFFLLLFLHRFWSEPLS